MAGGPLFPYSVVQITANTSPQYLWGPENYVGDGANAHTEKSHIAVVGRLGANAVIHLSFECPPTLPSGTAKLRAIALSDIETGNAVFNVDWVSVAVEEDSSAATLNAEGTQTITWASADDDVYKENKLTLDADTIVASEMVIMQIQFNTSGWTKTADTYFTFSIIWE